MSRREEEVLEEAMKIASEALAKALDDLPPSHANRPEVRVLRTAEGTLDVEITVRPNGWIVEGEGER
jgi:hypothetical protein